MAQSACTPTIIVYSKSGHSRRVAARVGDVLGVVPVEITTPQYTWPILGWLAAGRDGLRGRAAVIEQSLDVPQSGLVVLIGPVWAGGPASPLNTMIDVLKGGQQDVSAILTCGDPKAQTGPLDKIAMRLGRPLTSGLVLSNKAQNTSEGLARIDAFAAQIPSKVPES